MRASLGLIVVAVAACSTPSDIVKTGPTTYRVRTDADGVTPSDADIKSRGIARANEFCDAQGKRAVIDIGLTQGWHFWSVQTAEVRFFCDDRLPTRPTTSVSTATPAASAPTTPATSAPARSASAP
jgi:hypothetical protein